MMYASLFVTFFKIGLFAFGGGSAMLPLIFQGMCKYAGLTQQDFSDMVALSQITPGPVAVNAATYAGILCGGYLEAAVATIGVCLPCFLIMLIVCKMLEKFRNNKYVEGAFTGIRPMTVGLLASAIVLIGDGVLLKGEGLTLASLADPSVYCLPAIGIFLVSILLLGKFKINPIIIVIIMGLLGAFIC